jgi:hypothetical protein
MLNADIQFKKWATLNADIKFKKMGDAECRHSVQKWATLNADI